MGITDGLSGMEIMANLAGSSSGEAEMPALKRDWLFGILIAASIKANLYLRQFSQNFIIESFFLTSV